MQKYSLQVSTFILWDFNPENETVKEVIWYNRFRMFSLIKNNPGGNLYVFIKRSTSYGLFIKKDAI